MNLGPTASRIRRLGILTALLISATRGGAQTLPTAGDIVGTAIDQTGGVLPGTTIEARNLATNLTRRTRTGDDGTFALPALPPGEYRV